MMAAFIALNDSRIRSHLMPPAVDPAQAHWIVNSISTTMASGVHTDESAVAKPVVEATDIIWNRLYLSEIHIFG